MMKMKKITKYVFGVLAIFALVLSCALPGAAQASWDDYGLSSGYGWDYGDDWYYDATPVYSSYDYYDDYYDDDWYYDATPVYSSYDYYDYDYPSYDYGGYDYDYPSYQYQNTPQYSYSSPSSYPNSYYQYSTPSHTAPSYTPAPSYVYQYSTPTAVSNNTNTNTSNSNSSSNNVNNNNNANNNVNNNGNNINIVVNGGAPSSNNNNNQQNNLEGTCIASPSSVNVGQDVQFIANASGGTGNYSYSWSGTEGIYNNSRSFTGRFSYPGVKTATVVISSGSQSISRSCSVSVDNYQNPGYPTYNNLGIYCVASPSTAAINQTIVWTAYASGGNGNYSYSWTGTDGLSYSNAQSIQRAYTSAGYKSATVTVYSNGQSMSASCNASVTGGAPVSNVTVIRQPGAGNPVSGVYLSQVPATGIGMSMKVALFLAGLLIWSAYIGYVIVSRRKNVLAASAAGSTPARSASVPTQVQSAASLSDRINQFKLDNMRKRGLIK